MTEILEQQNISNPIETKTNVLFGETLVLKGLLSSSALSEALNEQKLNGGRLGEVLLRLKMLSERDIASSLAEYLSMEYFSLDDISIIDNGIARLLPEAVAKRFCVLAVSEKDGQIIIALSDPLNIVAIDTIRLKLKRQIKVVVSSAGEINRAIELIYHGSEVEEENLRNLVDYQIDQEQEQAQEQEGEEKDLTEANISSEAAASKAPVIRFVDLLLSQAVKSRASDIHIEPQENSMIIRMRIDGILQDMVPPARKMQSAVVTRVKILSKMDIAERRLPLDGRFKIKANDRSIDVRVSTIPTIYGEKVVMRILDSKAVNHNLNELGFEPKLLQKFKDILSQPHGIIIVTGPTGSGKSTTLYSALNYLRDPRKNITTVEDPVEYRLGGINQIQIKPEINLDFALSLRAVLRQDPDIILIGEIRDKETVEIAIKASLTGHLVLSTFHTNDAPSALSRLTFMGVEPYLLASTINLIVAQRLVRKICEHCKEPVVFPDEIVKRLRVSPEELSNVTFYHGKGCKNCRGSGYLGRLPIFEFLVPDYEIREQMTSHATEAQMRAMARQRGYSGLLESGVKKILAGLTTPEEVFGVAFMEDIQS
jgi:type IV pilus assembly protein PilB